MATNARARLDSAIRDGDHAAVRELVEADPRVLEQRNAEGHTPLDEAMWAVLVGDWSRPPRIAEDPEGRRLALVEQLLEAGAPVGRANEDGWTPLHTALYTGHVGLTSALLARGADPTAEAYAAGGTPLLQALFWGHAAAADALAAVAIDPLNLRTAAGLGHVGRIDAFFDASGEPLVGAGTRRSWYRPHTDFQPWEVGSGKQELLDEALAYAARNGRLQAVERLLDLGASVDADVYAGAPLNWATSCGRLEVIELLLTRGADIDRRSMFGTQRGATPLHAAAWMDRVDAIDLLLARGADPSLHDEQHDSTPLSWAQFGGAKRAEARLLRV